MKQLFYSLLVITSFASCKKDDIEPPEEPKEIFLLKELETQTDITQFTYNDKNQIVGGENYVKSINGSTPFNTWFKVIYQNDRPVEVHGRSEKDPDFTKQTELFYDDKGNIIKTYFTGFPDTTYRFRYNNYGKMIFFSMKTYIGLRETEFGYDGNGNLQQDDKDSTTQWTANDGIRIDSTYFTYHYTYDDKKNPFSYNNTGQFLAAMGMISEEEMELLLSQNNPLGYSKYRLYIPQNYLPKVNNVSKTTVRYINTFDSNGWLTSTYKESRVEHFSDGKSDFLYESNSPIMKFKIEKK